MTRRRHPHDRKFAADVKEQRIDHQQGQICRPSFQDLASVGGIFPNDESAYVSQRLISHSR